MISCCNVCFNQTLSKLNHSIDITRYRNHSRFHVIQRKMVSFLYVSKFIFVVAVKWKCTLGSLFSIKCNSFEKIVLVFCMEAGPDWGGTVEIAPGPPLQGGPSDAICMFWRKNSFEKLSWLKRDTRMQTLCSDVSWVSLMLSKISLQVWLSSSFSHHYWM